jgi:addiction module RelE/StbE family toxin
MRVVISAEAENDLFEIGAFIQPNNPKRAASFVEELLDRCVILADIPKAFPLIPRYENHGIRRYPYKDYLIFYRIHTESIEIIHILYGGRDYEKLLFNTSSE